MRKLLWGCSILGSLFVAGAAQAECSVSSDPGAVVRPLSPTTKADDDMIINMSLLPKLMHIDYDNVAKKKPACDLGQLVSGDATYELWGDDAGGRQRKAFPAKKNAPIALIVPVANLLKALTDPGPNKTAQVEGYLLATVTKADFTAWRYYTGMPDAAMLKHDMADALAGRGHPIFQTGGDGRINLFMPKN
jgi:hypothetical protein